MGVLRERCGKGRGRGEGRIVESGKKGRGYKKGGKEGVGYLLHGLRGIDAPRGSWGVVFILQGGGGGRPCPYP